MKFAASIVLAAVLASGGARADVWQDAIRGGPEPSKELYDRHLRQGDDHVQMADSRQIGRAEIARQVDLAVKAYRAAAATRPAEGEPWYRIAATLNSFYLETCGAPQYGIPASPLRDCPGIPGQINKPIAEQVLAAWKEFEQRAPLDPRTGAPPHEGTSRVGYAQNSLFERAILHTKLGTRAHIEEAARLYERAIRQGANVDDTVHSNLAETYMMLGRLDDALEAYRQIKAASDVSTSYGAAVVLDRAGNVEKAYELIRHHRREGLQEFASRVQDGRTFFVPYEETFYYLGLAEEAFGNYAQALEYFQMFVRSGAHPMFQARAKEHIEMLAKKRPRALPPPDQFRDFR